MEISSTQSPSRISSPNLTDVIKNILIPAVDSVGWNKNILTSVRLGDQREHFYLYLEGTNKNINFIGLQPMKFMLPLVARRIIHPVSIHQ